MVAPPQAVEEREAPRYDRNLPSFILNRKRLIMPLSSPAPRKLIHTRPISCTGYLREDGLWEVEGHLMDARNYDSSNQWRGEIPAGQPVHGMAMRIVFDENMTIRAIEVVTDEAPYPGSCSAAAGNYERLVGQRLGDGFFKNAQKHIGGTAGCTHQTLLLRVLAAVAMQTWYGCLHLTGNLAQAEKMHGDAAERPVLLNSCISHADDSEVAAVLWPDHYTGPRRDV